MAAVPARRSLLVVLLTAGLLLEAGAPARAGRLDATLTVSPAIGPPTTLVAVAGGGFGANETVDVRFDQHPLASTSSDGSGTVAASVTVPAAARPGSHVVWVRG